MKTHWAGVCAALILTAGGARAEEGAAPPTAAAPETAAPTREQAVKTIQVLQQIQQRLNPDVVGGSLIPPNDPSTMGLQFVETVTSQWLDSQEAAITKIAPKVTLLSTWVTNLRSAAVTARTMAHEQDAAETAAVDQKRREAMKIANVPERQNALMAIGKADMARRIAASDAMGVASYAPKDPAIDTANYLVEEYTPWMDVWTSAIHTERQVRANSKAEAGRICDVMACNENTRQQIVREKANPAGVVDLVALHEAGRTLQDGNEIIAARKKFFLRDQKKAFTPSMCR